MVKGKVKNIISEDDIEQTLVQRLQYVYGIDSLNCFTAKPDDLNDGSGRTDKRDVKNNDHLREACLTINPDIPEKVIDEQVIEKITDRRAAMNPVAANRELDTFIRDGVLHNFGYNHLFKHLRLVTADLILSYISMDYLLSLLNLKTLM